MEPHWFHATNIPYDQMWPDDIYWLPEILAGNRVLGTFTFNEDNAILTHKVEITKPLLN